MQDDQITLRYKMDNQLLVDRDNDRRKHLNYQRRFDQAHKEDTNTDEDDSFKTKGTIAKPVDW